MIEVTNLTRSNISEGFLRGVAQKVLDGEKIKGKSVSIVLITPKRAAELNRKYRKKDTVANVLSFEGEGEMLGEVLICPQQVKKEAKEYGMIFQKALAWMLVHGMLHLFKYNHEKEREAKRMEQKEYLYLSRL